MTNRNSNVSVVIPCYNHAETLGRAIQSALAQTLRPLEIIVVDDGSTDDSLAVAKHFGSAVTCIGQANAGPAAARNTGVMRAQGDWIAYLDADDYWAPEFHEECCHFLSGNPGVVGVSTGRRFNRLSAKAKVDAGPSSQGAFIIENFFSFWAEYDHICTGSCVLRRKSVIGAGMQRLDLRIAEDLEFWGLLATYGAWGFIPRVLWTCDSEPTAAMKGWTTKYRARRQSCPTVEQWQERIVPRLGEGDWAGFKQVRGKVAACFAQNHILAGRTACAHGIVERYGAEMPSIWLPRLLRAGAHLGPLGWVLACLLVRSREYQKALLFDIRRTVRCRRLNPREASPAYTSRVSCNPW